ncbi:unnamed protein product, partial [Tenebrio molitor]
KNLIFWTAEKSYVRQYCLQHNFINNFNAHLQNTSRI